MASRDVTAKSLRGDWWPNTSLPSSKRTRCGNNTSGAEPVARRLWYLLKHKEVFHPEVFAKAKEKMKRKKLARLQNFVAALNYQITPLP